MIESFSTPFLCVSHVTIEELFKNLRRTCQTHNLLLSVYNMWPLIHGKFLLKIWDFLVVSKLKDFFFTILEERFENEISQFVKREAFNSGAFSTKDV